MPKFDTPDPISVTIDRVVGDVRIVASERTDTSVDVRPSDPTKTLDVRGAENTQVEFSAGRLLVRGPKQRSFGRTESIDVTIQLPAGSHLQGGSDMGALECDGPLGDCRLKSGMGVIRIGETLSLQAKNAYGDVTVDRVVGDADISTASGEIRIGRITGAGVIKNANGDIHRR